MSDIIYEKIDNERIKFVVTVENVVNKEYRIKEIDNEIEGHQGIIDGLNAEKESINKLYN